MPISGELLLAAEHRLSKEYARQMRVNILDTAALIVNCAVYTTPKSDGYPGLSNFTEMVRVPVMYRPQTANKTTVYILKDVSILTHQCSVKRCQENWFLPPSVKVAIKSA